MQTPRHGQACNLADRKRHSSEDTLAKIAAEWEYDGGWQLKGRELYTQIVQNGEFRRNLVFGNGMLYKQQAVMDGSSVTYPLMAVEGKQELQNTINGRAGESLAALCRSAWQKKL